MGGCNSKDNLPKGNEDDSSDEPSWNSNPQNEKIDPAININWQIDERGSSSWEKVSVEASSLLDKFRYAEANEEVKIDHKGKTFTVNLKTNKTQDDEGVVGSVRYFQKVEWVALKKDDEIWDHYYQGNSLGEGFLLSCFYPFVALEHIHLRNLGMTGSVREVTHKVTKVSVYIIIDALVNVLI